jgi:exopolysaccharide biosynthesis protein
MKMRLKIIFVIINLLFQSFAFAQETEPKAVEKSALEKNTKKTVKSTEVSFEDVLVQGKYYFSDDNITTVEQDKVSEALLKVRKDFKDRIDSSSVRY